ncbi:MAG: sodium transporter, partial [Isosphaeraceae bacterium]|nr:sodium transporter [Isosphaeraceae bacterium]
MSKAGAIHAQPATLLALVIFTLVSLGLGVLANLVASRKAGFLRKYFLGNRSLGAFAVALTAAVMSGGTFMGFPSLVYKFGWVVGLWIASYMVAPLTVLGVLGKRIGQLSRKTGAITLPDLFRERFGSPALGLLTSLLIMFFLTCNLIPQFKAGGLIMKLVLPSDAVHYFVTEDTPATLDTGYYVGLAIFALTVVAYTTYGGFLAAIWTDVFQSLIMALGVIILFPLAMAASGGLAAATTQGIAQSDPGFAFGPGAGRNFHPITLAISYFVMWAITGMGQPSTMVRLMAFRDSRTLRYSILYLVIYNFLIYVPLIFIFVAARSILPGLEKSDEVMPRLVIHLANPYIAGLILAAPYGAVMSTVSGFLLIVASGLVRDVYQRFLRPMASEREIEWASYGATVLVGLIVTLVALNPPDYLQLIVVFSSTGMASAFLMPGLLGAFWRRATHQGALAAMLAGTAATLGLYFAGYM